MKRIEIITWLSCNSSCSFCASRGMDSGSLTLEEISAILQEYRAAGSVDFGGGEPTVRDDLPHLARIASALGYTGIGVKSNGMRFCYPGYAQLCMDAGINRFYISMWGHNPAAHDALAGRKGSFEMTEMGLKHLVDFGADVTADYMITSSTVEFSDVAFQKLMGIGIRKVRLWIFCVFGAGGKHEYLVPSLSAAGAAAEKICVAHEKCFESISTTHIMPCLLGSRPDIYMNIKEMELRVIGKDISFSAEDSPFETGTHVPACCGCIYESSCAGPRKEYLEIFGDKEFKKCGAASASSLKKKTAGGEQKTRGRRK